MQEATWVEEVVYFPFLVTAYCQLMPSFSYTAPCPHSQGLTNSRTLGSVLLPWKWHLLSECDMSYRCRTADLRCESTCVVVIVNDPVCSGNDLK